LGPAHHGDIVTETTQLQLRGWNPNKWQRKKVFQPNDAKAAFIKLFGVIFLRGPVFEPIVFGLKVECSTTVLLPLAGERDI
jgi:hypothetical protein